MRTYKDFLLRRKNINESFSKKNIEKVQDLINDILNKHIKGLLPLVGYADISDGDNKYLSKQYIIVSDNPKNENMFQINWKKDKDNLEPYSIDFFDNLNILYGARTKSTLTLYTLGTSIVHFLPIIWNVVNTGNYKLTEKEAIKLGNQIYTNSNVKESYCWIGDIKCHIIENLSKEEILEAYINEVDSNVKDLKKKKYNELNDAYTHRNDSDKALERYKKLRDEYVDLKHAIAGGANTLDEIRVAVKHNVSLSTEIDNTQQDLELEFKDKIQDPNKIFKMMESYVTMVVKGINPSVILCGAPGIGKTFRVKQILKANNYKEGENLYTIKGKCTTRRLYLSLYSYKDKGDIILIDDADSLVGPKAPEDTINILKGALDSTNEPEGRLVTYNINSPIHDDNGNELPKRFYYNGSIIIITNYNAGALDSALKGRSYIQNISFTVEQILQIIKDLIPNIEPNILSTESKMKAYDYMKELVDDEEEIEISIRTFKICAQIFESLEITDIDEDIAKLMIKEQLKLQALKLKNEKY